jgi:uncharacterized phage-like protein YoqJ
MIEENFVTHFISGMAIGIDIYAAQIVLDLKKQYPYLILECALPCETQANKWREKYREQLLRYAYCKAIKKQWTS